MRVRLLPKRLHHLQVAGMLTLDGRCKTLDASADGYVRAEAVIVVHLDPMSSPGANGGRTADPTDDSQPAAACLMAGSFVNQDGRSSSLTAPNGPSQQQVPHVYEADMLRRASRLTVLELCH
jgi:acyl transferase domain-containing protein